MDRNLLLSAFNALENYRRHTMTCQVCRNSGVANCEENAVIERFAWNLKEDVLDKLSEEG